MASTAILIAGSPSPSSRSTSLLDHFGQALVRRGFQTETVSIESFPSDVLLHGKFEAESVTRFADSLRRASALVFSTPVYKATYAGALKVIIDLIDPKALEGKALLALATARLEPHLAEVDLSFQRLYAFFKGSRPLPTLGLLDPQVGAPGAIALDNVAQRAFDDAVQRLAEAVQ